MIDNLVPIMFDGVKETLYMVIVSTSLAYLFGLPLGILLVVSDDKGIRPMKVLNRVLSFLNNILRSVPFIILLVMVSPFTRMIVRTTLGPSATIVPLSIAAIPFVGRLVESSLKEIEPGVVEAALSMGASTWQIIWKVLLVEARPSLIINAAIATTTILGYTAMSGFVGGGGLGTIAINYGYYRSEYLVMYIAVVLLVIIVQVLQESGYALAKRINRKLK